ncbi:MAG: tetratricopeptide repeat protein [Candidatus Krumholzibacteriia bacterium]
MISLPVVSRPNPVPRPGLRARAAACARLGVAAGVLALVLAGCARRVDTPSGRPPVGEPSGAEARVLVHTVAPGETLAVIADNYFGDPARAADIARQNGLDDPDRLAAGSTLMLRFDRDEWRQAQQRSQALEPYNRGVEALEQEQLAAAESQFRLALRAAPELFSARYNLALVLGRRGRHQEAEEILTELRVQRPEDADVAFALGHVLFQQTRFLEAAAAFRDVLERRPADRRALFGLARSLQESGDAQAAAAAWRTYLELDSTSSWADQARRYLRELPQ